MVTGTARGQKWCFVHLGRTHMRRLTPMAEKAPFAEGSEWSPESYFLFGLRMSRIIGLYSQLA